MGPVPPIRGGIAQHSARLVEAIRESGSATVVHSWKAQYPGALYRRPERDGEADLFPGTEWSLHWSNPLSWRRVGRALNRVERIVLPWTVPVHAPHYLAIMRRAGRPVSIHVHNALPHEKMPGSIRLARAVLRRADRLVTHSSSVAAECSVLAPGVPTTVVPHPPDLPVITRPLPAGPLRLLALGYLRDYKGTDLAIRAVAALADRGHPVRLTVAGEPWDGDATKWTELVAGLGMTEHVDLQLEYQPDTVVPELIANHHALIAPYRSATQSGVVAQALAAGRPVVATRVGGLPDVVVEGKNGTLAAPEDLNELIAAVDRLESNRESLAAGAARTKLSWADVAAAHLNGPHR